MRGDTEAPGTVALWCVTCGEQVTAAGGRGVHAATGRRLGGDGHPVDPVDYEPELWAAARRITADYGGAFTVGARFGILRADWSPRAGLDGTPVHYEAPGEAEMRSQLDTAVAGTRWEMPS